MLFLGRIFSKKADEDDETVLSDIAQDIQKRHLKLSEIRLRERRATLLVTIYAVAVWVAYVSVWYLELLPSRYRRRRGASISNVLRAVPVFLGPVIILFVRRIVQIWYARKGDAEEKTLQHLRKRQKTKIDEIKKRTNYESTRSLVQKYGESAPVNPVNGFQPPTTPAQLRIPQRPLPASPLTPLSPPPSVPPRKQWYDKVVDAVLGDDDYTPSSAVARYALICEKCFAHNGLVKETLWADTQYMCPKCNHFNASHNSRKSHRSRLSLASSPPQISPQVSQQVSSSGSPLREEPRSPTPPSADTTLEEADDS